MKTLLIFLFIALGIIVNAQPAERFVVHFDFDKYEITPQAKQRLDSFLRSTPVSSIKKIDLSGHCDAIGSNSYNDRLSEKRVDAVKNYLLAHNVGDVFDNVKGFGKHQPLNTNSSAEERYMNRRVEINIERSQEEKTTVTIVPPVKKEQTLSEKIKDTATKTGTNIVLKNMNFYGGLHRMMPESIPVLRELLQTMQQNPTLVIEIHGHICCEIGPQEGFDNETGTRTLSLNRARVVYQYLVQNGISPQRLSYRGFGHQFPLYPDDTDEHKLLNRRVEIKIIKK